MLIMDFYNVLNVISCEFFWIKVWNKIEINHCNIGQCHCNINNKAILCELHKSEEKLQNFKFSFPIIFT